MKLKEFTVKGKLMEVKPTKKGDSLCAVVYCEGELIRIFGVSEGLKAKVGQDVVLTVEGFAKEVFLKHKF